MLGFLIAVAAGAATPFLEGPVARPVARALGAQIKITEPELRTLAYIIALIGAALICAVLNVGSMLGLVVGGALGYFGLRLLRWLQRVIKAKRG